MTPGAVCALKRRDRTRSRRAECRHRLFVAKWQGSTRTERAAAQEHFIDLCRMLGQSTPNDSLRVSSS
jgi:hypothetical protein